MKKTVARFDGIWHITGRWDRDSIRAPTGARPKTRFPRLISYASYGIIQKATPERRTTMKNPIRSTPEFKALRAEVREAMAAYADGADFLFTISRLAAIGERMNVLLA